MKINTKITFGLSIAAIAGVYVSVALSEEIITKLQNEKTRYKTKKMINKKFNGNGKLLTIVDNLTDKELNSIDTVAMLIKNNKIKIEELVKK